MPLFQVTVKMATDTGAKVVTKCFQNKRVAAHYMHHAASRYPLCDVDMQTYGHTIYTDVESAAESLAFAMDDNRRPVGFIHDWSRVDNQR